MSRATSGIRALPTVFLAALLGAMLFFAAVVAPASFAVAPTPEVAGRLVGRLLRFLHLGGALVLLCTAAAAAATGRSRLLRFGPVLLAALCLLSHFGVSLPLAELREAGLGDPGSDARTRFRSLHQLSVAIFAFVMVGTGYLVYRHIREDSG